MKQNFLLVSMTLGDIFRVLIALKSKQAQDGIIKIPLWNSLSLYRCLKPKVANEKNFHKWLQSILLYV